MGGQATTGSPHVVALGGGTDLRSDLIGAEATALGALVQAGLRVPAAFAVTADAYRDWVGVRSTSLQEGFCESVELAYAALGRGAGRDVPVEVRSWVTGAGSRDADCSGRALARSGISGADGVLGQIEECWLTAFDSRAGAPAPGWPTASDDGVAVVVQELVDARVSGVLSTGPRHGDDGSLLVIEARYGSGEQSAAGLATPDLLEIDRDTREVNRRRLGSKETECRLSADRRSVETRPVEPVRQGRWALTEQELGLLVDLAPRVEAVFGLPVHVEWAIGDSEREQDELFVLRMRPLPSEAPVLCGQGAAVGAVGTLLRGSGSR